MKYIDILLEQNQSLLDYDEFSDISLEVVPSSREASFSKVNTILLDKFINVFEQKHDTYLAKILQVGINTTITNFVNRIVFKTECKYLKTFIISNLDEVKSKLLDGINEYLASKIDELEKKQIKNQEIAAKRNKTRNKNKQKQQAILDNQALLLQHLTQNVKPTN